MENIDKDFDTAPLPPPASLEEAQAVIAAMRQVIRDQKEKYERDVRRDPSLQSMLNKRATGERVVERINEGKPFGLFFIDIDNLKKYNDTFGHPEGDDLLLDIEKLLNATFNRGDDVIGSMSLEAGRIGGDEFLLIMADLYTAEDSLQVKDDRRTTDPQRQMENIYKLLRHIEDVVLITNEWARSVEVGFSIGTTIFDPEQPVSAEKLIKLADRAMYDEKERKRVRR